MTKCKPLYCMPYIYIKLVVVGALCIIGAKMT
jgi:hypothetical protein